MDSFFLGGRWKVARKLGAGAGGEVLLASDRLAGDAPRAVKILARPELERNLRAEFAALAALSHPGVVRLHAFGHDAVRGPFLVTDFVDGPDFVEAARGLGDAGRARLIARLLSALAYVHARGLLHLDLKPGNVLVEGGRPRLLDFGLAGGEWTSADGGTPAYAAPEQLRGRMVDRRADLYAVGALICEVLTGAPPRRDGVNDLGGPLGSFAAALLRPDPEDRPADAAAALELLAETGLAESRSDPAEAAAYVAHRPAEVRAAALSAIAAGLQAGRAVVVLGPAGSGRHALLGEVARRSAGAGGLVLRTGEGAAPLEALLPAIHAANALAPADQARGARALLAPWLGAHASRPVDVAAPAGLGAAAGELIAAAAAAERGLLVIFDRLDELDPASRAAFFELASRRIAVLASAEEGVEMAHEVALPPLGLPEVQSFLASVYPGRAVPESFAQAFLDWSGGLPSVLEDGVRALAELEVATPGAISRQPLPAIVPEGAFPAASETAARTASRAIGVSRELAAVLALARLPIRLGRLAAVAGLSEQSATGLVERLAAEGAAIVEEGRARIAGEAIAAAIRGSLPTEIRVDLHRRLAAEARASAAVAVGAAAAIHAADEARHLHAAEDPSAPAAALAAGLRCAETSAHREAVELLTVALEAGLGDGSARCRLAASRAATGDTAGALTDYMLASAAGAAAEAAIGAAEVHVRKGAYREAAAALEAVEAPADPALRGRWLASLARTLALSGRGAEALSRTEEGLSGEGYGGRIAADLEAARGLALYLAGRAEEAVAAYGRADELAVAAGDPGRRASAANGKAMVAHRRGDTATASALYGEALRLSREAFDLSRAGACHLNLGALAQDAGDTSSAAEHYRQAAAVARALGDPHAVARAELNLGVLYRFVGRLEAARKAAVNGRAAARRAGAAQVAALCAAVEGEVLLLSGEIPAARDLLGLAQEGITTGVEGLDIELALAQADLAAGASRESRDRARAVVERSSDFPSIRMRALLAVAEAELALPTPKVAEARKALYEALALVESHQRPDVAWRLHRALFVAHRAAGENELARSEAATARRLLADASRRLPPADRSPFLARPDRRRANEELGLAAPVGGGDGSATRILALNRRLAEERDADRLLAAIVDAAIELSGAERGFILLPSDDDGFEIRVARGFDRGEGQVPVSRSIAERVMRSGEPELSVDALEDDRYRDQLSIHNLRLRSVICLPLGFRGERVGALYLDNRLRTRVFADEAVALLESFADQAGIALGNARLLAETEAARAEAARSAEEVRRLAERLEEQVEVQAAELASAREALGDVQAPGGLVGQSTPMRRLFRAIEKVAAVGVPVLVQGESGTGKELVARAIHTCGPRREKPFVGVNCAALAETVLESELFGHVRGAFTGADRDRRGLFELADGGTLLLDEVADMSLSMQAKLLRALQSGEIWKVGGRAPLRVDVRVVAATNKPLAGEVVAGRFREDLYYRLNVVTLEVPPLRERKDDVPLLVEHVLKGLRNDPSGAKRRLRVDGAALQALSQHDWPGNVRELEASLKNAAIFAEGGVIRTTDLGFLRGAPILNLRSADPAPAETVALAEAELVLIERTLEKTGGNKALAARLLGIDRKTLYNKLRRLERE